MKGKSSSRLQSGRSRSDAPKRLPQAGSGDEGQRLSEEDRLRHTCQSVQTQRIEALGKLASALAHEFKNILQSILINAELVADMIADGTMEREYVDQIIEAALRGRNLVGRINPPGMHRKDPQGPVDARLIVQDALNVLHRSLRQDITFRQWLGTAKCPILVEPAQLRQVVSNLYSNALEAMSGGKGFLGVSLKRRKIDQITPALVSDLVPGDYVQLTIRDTGAGISPEIMDRIFDPFFTTGVPGQKTGLGLAVVYAVVSHARGAIMVESTPGKGSRFKIYFPLWAGEDMSSKRPVVQGQA